MEKIKGRPTLNVFTSRWSIDLPPHSWIYDRKAIKTVKPMQEDILTEVHQ